VEKKALKTFWFWVNERESIRVNREEYDLPPPWTEDNILRHYRFCNVRREDDRVTRWINDNIRQPYQYDLNLWFMLAMARHFNLPATLQYIIDNDLMPTEENGFKHKRMAGKLNGRMIDQPVFNAAYIINAAGALASHTKVDHVCQTVLYSLWKDRDKLVPLLSSSVQEATEALMTYPGMGSFMAYQVVTDLTWCPQWLSNAPDINTWAAIGPGSKRGINRLLGRPVRDHMTIPEGLDTMLWLHANQLKYLDDSVFTKPIRLNDIQNCLCEFDKYSRALNNEGTPKRKVYYEN